jgi:hypothetical protein
MVRSMGGKEGGDRIDNGMKVPIRLLPQSSMLDTYNRFLLLYCGRNVRIV